MTSGRQPWHGLPPTASGACGRATPAPRFYSHPAAWDEIGFSGPAYPRGYKNLGVGRREPFEVPDARPAEDPVRERL